ncbi:MAG: phosphodiester glycosidase family protein [Oscillospiraceae bacterium]|nr:phosphodiester glycosidase family protein [Oscillospiraceae bacterium]
MRARIITITTVIVLIFSLLMAFPAMAVGDVVYTNTRMIADNLEFRNTISWHGTLGRTESFALTMTGEGAARPMIMKGDTLFGTTSISNMVSLAESRGLNVLAAMNTDFFFTQHGGVPMGIVIEDGVFKSSAGGRNAVIFGYDGSVDIIPPPIVWISLTNNGGNAEYNNAGQQVILSHFNKPRTERGGMVLYSEIFSTVSTRTTTPGWSVRFRILSGTPSVSGTMLLEVTETLISEDAMPIGEGYMVLTAAEMSDLGHEFEKFAVGDVVTLSTSVTDQRLLNARYATGGGYILVSDGVVADASNWSSALQTRAPRTAFGIRADGSVISIVVDGRAPNHSVGMTLSELAEEMLRQGAVYAVNFDGGGSSAMSLRIPGERETTVISRPSDGSERRCATYLLFVTDVSPGGSVRNLGLRNDGVIVLAESEVDLIPIATDAGFMPVGVPDDIQVTAMIPGAIINELNYIAGSVAGPDRLRLYSPSTGAIGEGEVFVITRPTSISATRVGSTTPLTSIRLSPEEVLELNVTATYYRRLVTAQINSFEFEVTGNIGQMIEPGVFAAGETVAQSGTITISAGGRSLEINVEIAGFEDMHNHWARDYAEFLASVGITTGVTPTQYGPELPMLRGDFILMLHRAAGSPEAVELSGFEDVPEDAYFAEAMAWAREVGVVGGTGGGTFEPLMPVTRASAFTFTYRALGVLGIDFETGTAEDLEDFADAGSVPDFAIIPTATLIRLGIVEGANGMLISDSTLTRAQMAKVLAMVLQM